MNDADFMLRLRAHEEGDECGPAPAPAGPGRRIRVHPDTVAKRQAGKSRIPSHPTAAPAGDLLRGIDQRMASLPAYDKPSWTIGEVVRWIIKRTPAAVDGISVDEERLQEVLPELQNAFVRGEVKASGHTCSDPIRRVLSADTFEIHPLTIEIKEDLLRVLPLADGAAEQAILDVLVDRSGVLQRWPAPDGKDAANSTIATEYRTKAWLAGIMRASQVVPRPKQEMFKEAVSLFGIGWQAFRRVWSAAIRETNSHAWSKAGRRSNRIGTPS